MPYTVTLDKTGISLIVNDEVELRKIQQAMNRGEAIHLKTITNKDLLVRGSDIVLVRETSQAEIVENQERLAKQREQEARFHPAPGQGKIVTPEMRLVGKR